MKIDGAILDLDGTLLDSVSIWDNVAEDYLRKKGIQPKHGLRENLETLSLQKAARYLQSEYGLTDSVEEIINGVCSLIEHFYVHEVLPKEGVPEFLQILHHKGVKMCIATATERYLVEAALKRNGILEYFDEILTCSSLGHGKDEPHIYEAALRHLGTLQSSTWVFEDMLYAISTAKAAGFPVVGVYEAHEKHPEKIRALADLYIHSFREMEDMICV